MLKNYVYLLNIYHVFVNKLVEKMQNIGLTSTQ